jgi:phosphoglycolate phosphatase-like HAD superfamily hydrolase
MSADARRLVLFDIDGTLLSAGPVSRSALVDALTEIYGVTGPVDEYDFSGKTDPQIVRELMESAGLAEDAWQRGFERCLEVYRGHLTTRLRPHHVRAKPGVVELVQALAADRRVALGLLTGNIEACARVKLAPLDLNGFFPFGAYGSDHHDRHRLPAVAVERARALTGEVFTGKRIVVVGDSIHDVRCGRGLGVRAVAVATGLTPAQMLAAEEPDALLTDFSDTGAAMAAILG